MDAAPGGTAFLGCAGTGQTSTGQKACATQTGRGAFTLVELVLALGIVALLAAAVVLNVGGLFRRSGLEETVRNFETSLRMARAEAAHLGKRVQLAFDGESGAMRVLWEPQPLTTPGFVDYGACTWAGEASSDSVRIDRCELTGDSAYQPMAGAMNAAKASEATMQAITFYPDGSSDSAVVEMRPTAEDDTRVAIVELDGLNGTITSRILTAQEATEEQQ